MCNSQAALHHSLAVGPSDRGPCAFFNKFMLSAFVNYRCLKHRAQDRTVLPECKDGADTWKSHPMDYKREAATAAPGHRGTPGSQKFPAALSCTCSLAGSRLWESQGDKYLAKMVVEGIVVESMKPATPTSPLTWYFLPCFPWHFFHFRKPPIIPLSMWTIFYLRSRKQLHPNT